jgi:hypothetical protein
VVAALEEALELHELLKLRTSGEDRAERDAVVAALLARTGAELVQRIGHVAVLYRRAKEPKLDLPGMPLIVRKAAQEPVSRRADTPYGRAPAKGKAKPAGESKGKPKAGGRATGYGRAETAAKGKPKAGARAAAGYGRPETAAKRPTKLFGRAKSLASRRGGNRPS